MLGIGIERNANCFEIETSGAVPGAIIGTCFRPSVPLAARGTPYQDPFPNLE